MADEPTLKERVILFNTLRLPGQPFGMHMGTSYLVNDLDQEVDRLQAENKALREALSRRNRCLAFFASVIKSGEPWTDTCEAEYQAATGEPWPEVRAALASQQDGGTR